MCRGGGNSWQYSGSTQSDVPARYCCLTNRNQEESVMVKNVLAAVGLVVVIQKGYALYQKYREMEQENEDLRKAAADAK